MGRWARLSEAWCSYGVWRSLVARFVRDEEVAGSNPVTPTSRIPGQMDIQILDRSLRAASTTAKYSSHLSAGSRQAAAAPLVWQPSWHLRRSPS
jgi:hypothetical protein